MNQSVIDKTNKTYDLQINGRKATKFKRGYRANPNFKIDKELFNLSLQLDINDWREIRCGNFWKTIDKIEGRDNKNFFLLTKVKEYLNIRITD